MATEDTIQEIPTQEVQLEQGVSEIPKVEEDTIKSPEDKDADSYAVLPDPKGLDEDLSDSNKASDSKTLPTSDDFYERFLDAQDKADFSKDLQSSDTYWNNRTEERKQYEAQYGDKAREEFDKKYATVEQLWRQKLNTNTEKAVMNERYDWLFGNGPNISYDQEPVFEATQQIFNGARRLDTLLTDKTMSDREAALASKTYQNDNGELVELKDNEKWYSWSKGTGTEMNADDPRHLSKDGKKIVGFQYDHFDPEFRGTPYVKAIYDGDKPTGELVSLWDTTNNWLMKSNTKTAGSIFKMLPHTAIRTVTNITADVISGTASILGSASNLLDMDDSGNAFIDAMNNTSSFVKSRKMSVSEYDQSKLVTTSNMLDFVAQVASQLYVGAGMFKGVSALTKVFLAGNPLLKEAAVLKKAGDFLNSGRKIAEFEMKYGFAARQASLVGLTLATGDQIVTSARQAGFSEDETAGIYIAYFGAMMAANTLSARMLEPYFTKAAAEPIMRKTIADATPLFRSAVTDKAKFNMARDLVKKMVTAVKAIPSLGAIAAHTPKTLAFKSLMYRGLNEAMEEELENVGQAGVELFATQIAKRTHKGEKDIPKFDTFLEEGYWARQLPNIVMSGLGGFLGGASTHFLPGFSQQNEHDYLVQGDDKARMMKIAMVGGEDEQRFLKTLTKQKKGGSLGSDALSVKMDEKTGEFYKMTDKQAEGTLSHSEAAYRAIMNQFLTYKTLYGGSKNSYDEIIKADPTLLNQLDQQKDHVFHAELTRLHDEKYKYIQEIMGDKDIPVPLETPKTKKTASIESQDTPEKVSPIDQTKNKGVVAEPIEVDEKAVKKQAKDFSEQVMQRATTLGTTKYDVVKNIIRIENTIADILSGNAAAKQVVHSMVRNGKISAFIGEEQKEFFGEITNAAGGKETSPFANFGDNLLEAIFSADINLAKGHDVRHKEYIESAKAISDIINSDFTGEDIHRIATSAYKKPKSIAIDKDTTQIQKLGEGVNKLLTKLISNKEFAILVSSARTSMGLAQNMTTEDYNKLLVDKANDAIDNGTLITVSPDEIQMFVDDNLDLIHKTSLSMVIDKLSEKPTNLLVSQLNVNQGQFKEQLISRLSNIQGLTIEGAQEESTAVVASLTSEIDNIRKSLENLSAKEPKNAAEKVAQERQSSKLRQEIAAKQVDLDSAINAQANEGTFDKILPAIGASVIENLSKEATVGQLTPVIRVSSPALEQARTIIADFRTIIENIAPVMPTVPKLGAVYNLLNEISLDGNNLVSTINKIIPEMDEEDLFTVIEGNKTIRAEAIPSLLEQLHNTVINENSANPEFRNLEGAKHLLNAINIRMAQVQTIALTMDKLSLLRHYSKEHIPLSDNQYDQLPRFMAEYIFDPERRDFLIKKNVRSKQEEEDLSDMLVREELLKNFERPESVYARLAKAKEDVEGLINIGEKSMDMNERYRVYVTEVASHLNLVRKGINDIDSFKGATPRLDEAIAKFNGVSDTFTESSPEGLIAGNDALEDIYRAINELPTNIKDGFLTSVRSYTTPGKGVSYAFTFIADAIATHPDQFKHYYNAVLGESNKKGGIQAPTMDQEHMIRSTFSFLTDESKAFAKYPGNHSKVSLFVDGGNGTGKSTMVGYGIASAQQYMTTQAKINPKFKPTDNVSYNTAIFAAPFSHQAKNIEALCTEKGAIGNKIGALTKDELYTFLKDKSSIDDVSMIVFDEATFIQGAPSEEGGISELKWFADKITDLNKTRSDRGLPEIKFLLIGDQNQGGFHQGMPTMFDPQGSQVVFDYSTLGEKSFPTAGPDFVDRTNRLTYPFRTLCSKISEISDSLINLNNEIYSGIGGSAKRTTKLIVANGIIGNDVKERTRMGGVEVVTNPSDLYTGPGTQTLVDNITKQLNADKTDNVLGKKRFSVLIVDDRFKNLKDIPDGPLKTLIESPNTPANTFILRTIASVQGGEADYVIANTNDIFPRLPIIDLNASAKISKLAMVISRARLFAKISANSDVNIETASNAVISMLPATEATELENRWNKFYLEQFRQVGQVIPAPENKPQADAEIQSIDDKEIKIAEEDKVATELVAPALPPVNKQDVIDNPGLGIQEGFITETATVVINANDIITQDKVEQTITENEAIINNPDPKISQTDKATAEEKIRKAWNSVSIFEDLIGDPVPSPLGNAIDPVVEEAKSAIHELPTDVARKEAIELENLGSILSYIKIADGESIASQTSKRRYFASDLFGFGPYKFNGNDTKAEIEIRRVMSDMQKFEPADKRALSNYQFSLVSFQTHDTKTKRDVVVHQIYAKHINSDVKVPVVMFPTEQLGTFGSTSKLLKGRETVIVEAHKALKTLSEDPRTAHLFDDKAVTFGPAGVTPLTNAKIDMIATNLKMIYPSGEISFPQNTELTKIGRVAISDPLDITNSERDYRTGKMELSNWPIGLLYMETRIPDITKVFQAVTPGKPIKSSTESHKKYAAQVTGARSEYIKSLPSDDNVYTNKALIKPVTEAKSDNGGSTDSNMIRTLSSNIQPLSGTSLITKYKDSTIIVFKGINGRNIAVHSTSRGKFELLFGFGTDGKAISPDQKFNRDITGDLEATKLLKTLDKNNILKENSIDITYNATSLDDINDKLGRQLGYTLEQINGKSTGDRLSIMSQQFMDGKIMKFSDLQISLGELRRLVGSDGVQISDALTFTKTTIGDHQGKSFILYTYHDKSKYDLNDTATLNQLLTRLGIVKASDLDPKTYNPEKFAKHGIGIIMLDSKMETLDGLLTRYRGKKTEDMNRASSPVKSKTNQRMVSFITELTRLIHDTSVKMVTPGLHNNLSKMGLKKDGTPIVEIFNGNAKKAIIDILVKMKSETPVKFDKLHTLLTGITSDANLGFVVLNSKNDPQSVRDFLLITDREQRVQFWEDNFENKELTKDVSDSLARYNISGQNLFGTTDVQQGKDGKILGKIIVDRLTNRPLVINTEHNPLSFISPDILPGAEATFNMLNFIKSLNKVGGVDASAIARDLDGFMKGYANEGTLRKGVMWTGKLSTSLASSLSVAKVSALDANDMFLTSVKELNPPSILISSKGLIDTVTNEKAPKKSLSVQPNDAISDAEQQSQARTELKTFVDLEIDKFDPMASQKEIIAAKNIAMQNIGQEFPKYKDLFEEKNFTTMKNEMIAYFNSKTVEKTPSKQETRNNESIKQIETELKPFEERTSSDTITNDILSDIASVVAGKSDPKYTPQQYIRYLTDRVNREAEQNAITVDQQSTLLSRIKMHEETFGPDTTPQPVGETIMRTLDLHANYNANVTPSQKRVMNTLLESIDNKNLELTAKQLKNIPDMMTILTNPEALVVLDEEEQLAVMNNGAKLQLELLMMAGDTKGNLKFSDQQMDDLNDAFKHLTKRCD